MKKYNKEKKNLPLNFPLNNMENINTKEEGIS